MSNALLRHWQMLSLIPRAPRKIDAATMHTELIERGFHVDLRSVQRDLIKLSARFPLVTNEVMKPYGWSWAKDADTFDVPGMDRHTALAFALADRHLACLLPHATLDHLQPYFGRAAAVLDADANALRAWRDSVRVLPTGLPMAPPVTDQDVLERVQDGLLGRRKLVVRYRPRGQDEARSYDVHPLGLVHRDHIAYLVAVFFDYSNPVQLAVHRFESVEVTNEPGRVPDGFDLDDYIASGEFGYLVGEQPLALVVLLQRNVAIRLYETPMAADQQLIDLVDGRVEVRATVANTAQLRVWLRGHGRLCEVAAPAELRAELAAEAADVVASYGGN